MIMKILTATYLILLVLSLTGYSQETDSRIFNDTTIRISEIGTNTIRSDFGPSVVGDSLYFTTYRDKVMGKTDKKLRKKAFYDLYKAHIDSNGNTISTREPIKEFITRYHDGQVSWCTKTGELFVTQSENLSALPFLQTWRTDTVRLRIVIAQGNNGRWDSITEFPFNNPLYSVGHPAITESGDTLVFTSNMPGGYGETDLYYSIRKNGKWNTPVNLGQSLNTSGKEEFPFITDADSGGSNLLFSSTGRPGNGGLDLYYTRFPINPDNQVSHFEAPLNSSYDDYAMVLPRHTEFGYLTSDRPGTGNDDIYKFTFRRISKPPANPLRELYVFNQRSLLPISGVTVTYCNTQYFLTDTAGKIGSLAFIENCEVLTSKIGYPDTKKQVFTKEFPVGEIPRDTVWLNPGINKDITLSNIYYDLDKWDILPEAAYELNQLVSFMNKNPNLTVELGSHTDSRASKQYNMRLSQRRAESAVNYVVSKGIAVSRITEKGNGEAQLLNSCFDGIDCLPEEHRQNRRTEIFIPDFGKSKEVKQTKGDYTDNKTDQTKTSKVIAGTNH